MEEEIIVCTYCYKNGIAKPTDCTTICQEHGYSKRNPPNYRKITKEELNNQNTKQ